MKDRTELKVEFNINDIKVYGCVKSNDRDTFIEILYYDSKHELQTHRKLYNGSLDNKEQAISEMESLIGEYLDK